MNCSHQTLVMLAAFFCQLMIFLHSVLADDLVTPPDYSRQLLLKKPPLDTIHRVSALDCVGLCRGMTSCSVCRYHVEIKMCQMRGFTDNSTDPRGTVMPLSLLKTSTEGIQCGEAPDIPNAKKDTKGHSLGDITTYTCHSDFIQCPKKPSESVCRASGQWEELAGLCERFRWTKREDKYSIPCGPAKKMIVTVKATPLKRTRFSVGICGHRRVLLLASFRLHFGKHHNVLVLASKTNRKWRNLEVKQHVAMAPGKQLTAVITFKRGHCKVKVNGKERKGFKIRTSILAEYLTMDFDFSLQLLQLERYK